MTAAIRDLVAASRRIRGYVRFIVANEEAVEGDLQALRDWLKALERVEKEEAQK